MGDPNANRCSFIALSVAQLYTALLMLTWNTDLTESVELLKSNKDLMKDKDKMQKTKINPKH